MSLVNSHRQSSMLSPATQSASPSSHAIIPSLHPTSTPHVWPMASLTLDSTQRGFRTRRSILITLSRMLVRRCSSSGTRPYPFQYPKEVRKLTFEFNSRQKNECKNGMVFAVNPTSNEQFKEFYTNAVGAPTSSTRSALSAASSTASSSASHSTLSTHTSAKSYATPIPKEKREGFVPREYKGPE